MGMVGGLDVHRAQITFDWVDHDTGETGRGRVAPATREVFRSWLEQLPTREGAFAVEATTRQWLAEVDLPAASRHAIAVALGQIDQLAVTLNPIDRWLRAYARRQPGCRALIANHYGVGLITAPTILAEIGDVRRFRNGDAVVRYTGLDVTVYSSDGKRSPGHLARQGPPALRWALLEAAMANASRPTATDYDYYHEVKDRVGGKRPGLSVARKLARRIRFTLTELGDEALAPVDDAELPDLSDVSMPDPMPAAA
jgi:transposase